jgi:hypothetical protein
MAPPITSISLIQQGLWTTRRANHAHVDLMGERNIRCKAALPGDQWRVLKTRH